MRHHNKLISTQPGHDPGLDQTVLSRLAYLAPEVLKQLTCGREATAVRSFSLSVQAPFDMAPG